MFIAFATASATVASWLLLRVLIPQLRRRLPDEPNARSSHLQQTPRGGGIAFVVVTSVSSLMAMLSGQGLPAVALPFSATPLAIVGLLDDRQNLPSLWRYGAQLFTAAVILGSSKLVKEFVFSSSVGTWLLLFGLSLLLISFTAVINFTNFMDGLDGLVGGCMAIAIVPLLLSLNASWSLWTLVGSLFGFLLWNWSPAKVFMGDVGSTFIGAVFAGLVLQVSSWPEAFGCLMVATPLLADACICVPRRWLAGQRVFQAHRLHLFQRLHQAGWTHARVSLTSLLQPVLAVCMFAGGWSWVISLAFAELLFGVWLDQCVAVPFSVASKR